MSSCVRSRCIAVATSMIVALAAVPGVASAHGVSTTRFDAPLPLPLLFGGAGATVALTALWLGVAVDADALSARRWRIATIPSGFANAVRLLLRAGFSLAVLGVLVFGATGRQVPATNLATVFTWPIWFRGLAVLAILVGTPWPVLSPWRTIYQALCRLEGRLIAVAGEYPRRLRAWPALVGFLVFIGVVENLTVIPRSPRLTAVLVALYALAMIGGAVLWGQSWLRWADPLGVLYRLLGRVAPLEFGARDSGRSYTVTVRTPWIGCLDPVRSVSLVVFVVAMVYTVSFDGFTNIPLFQDLLFDARGALGTGPGTSVLLYLGGLIGFVATFLATSWLVERLGAGDGDAWLDTARAFAPTVLPIAAAYEVAHNYSYVARNLGQLATLLLDPVVSSLGTIRPLG